MDLATLIVGVMVLLGIAALWMGATVGVPGVVKPPPQPRPEPALAGLPLRPGQIQQEAFAREAERAVAARALTPASDPDDSVGMQMKVMSGILAAALVIVAMGAYIIWEPAREAEASQRQLHQNVLLGAKEFTTYCAKCHGPTGTGLIGPNLHLAQFAARYKYDPNNPSDMAKLRALVIQTITNGRFGTPMPTWGDQWGGPLNEAQISNLADLIMTDGWQYVVPAPGAAGAPAATTPAAGAASSGGTATSGGAAPAANAPPGQALMAKYGCFGCHTIDGVPGATGTVGPNLSHIASQPKIPLEGVLVNNPANLQKWIFDAPSVVPGTIMPNFSQQGMTSADAKTIVDYLETLK
jgi:mono/diheme cytochrome c family protein